MKRKLLVFSVIIAILITMVGCSNTSATSEQSTVVSSNPVQDATAVQSTTQEETSKEDNSSNSDKVIDVEKPNVNWQDYVDQEGVFSIDEYAEALGYRVIEVDKSTSWYIYDTVKCHYCILAYMDTLGIMLDNDDTSYSINIVSNDSETDLQEQRIQEDKSNVSKQWVEEASSILNFIVMNWPTENEIYNYPEITTAKMSCTKWTKGFIIDERGAVVDFLGPAELYWEKNR